MLVAYKIYIKKNHCGWKPFTNFNKLINKTSIIIATFIILDKENNLGDFLTASMWSIWYVGLWLKDFVVTNEYYTYCIRSFSKFVSKYWIRNTRVDLYAYIQAVLNICHKKRCILRNSCFSEMLHFLLGFDILYLSFSIF